MIGRASDDVEVLDDGTAAHIEEILAHAAIARTLPLSAPDVGELMLHRDTLAELASSTRGCDLAAGTWIVSSLRRCDYGWHSGLAWFELS